VFLGMSLVGAGCGTSSVQPQKSANPQAQSNSTVPSTFAPATTTPTTSAEIGRSGYKAIGTVVTTNGSATLSETYAIGKILTNDADGNHHLLHNLLFKPVLGISRLLPMTPSISPEQLRSLTRERCR